MFTQKIYLFLDVFYNINFCILEDFPCGSDGKESACNVGDPGVTPELGRSPGEGNGNPLQYSCLDNSMDSGVHGVSKSQTRLSDFTFTLYFKKLIAYSFP